MSGDLLLDQLRQGREHPHDAHMIVRARGGWCIGCEIVARLRIAEVIHSGANVAHEEIKRTMRHARRCIGQQYRRGLEAIKG